MKNILIHEYLIMDDNFLIFNNNYFQESHKRMNNQSQIFKIKISLG
jgi:hypothetical protein